MAVGVLEHGVAALERGQRREGLGAGALVADVVGGPVEPVAQRAAGPPSSSSTSSERAASRLRGSAIAGRERSWASRSCSRARAGDDERRRSRAQVDAARPPRPCRARRAWRRRWAWRHGRRRRGRAAAGRARGRSRTRRGCASGAPPGPAPRRRTAAGPRPSRRRGRRRSTSTSGLRSSLLERLDHLARRAGALHGGVGHLELHGGPAAARILEDVALGGAVGRGHQADPTGEERQVALELGGEQALGGEQLAAPLEPGEQLAETDHADLAGGQRERAAVGVEGAGRARRRWRPRRAAG